ncbi:unnamed protein product [Clonostachys rhizophaga]|uniref:Peptidase C14 caspase domain-containing protein n=1 Tax=Clonostachys rhizophaga TaxID=160324 RepID=A0A9N9YJ77_9HYPO|nr:unnamed protein product [Clonostachys rhizophaga]
MFAWYRDSKVCYVYMAGVPCISQDDRQFGSSRWFTRGWTLQELLAPTNVVFYDQSWSMIGSKDILLLCAISQITGIDKKFLNGISHLREASVAKKMSWLAHRKTTRTEDIAYCVMGIFEINMPLLYGEGEKAFTRLQEEIMRVCNDHTIFCWEWDNSVPEDWGGMLAPSPLVFRHSANFVPLNHGEMEPYSMTNLGLSIRLPVIFTFSSDLFVILEAIKFPATTAKFACIRIRCPKRGIVTVDRVSFPPEPMLFKLNVVRPRRSLFARTANSPHFRIYAEPPIESRFGLLLVIDCLDFVHPNPITTESMIETIVNTWPPGVFDESRNLLIIPPSTDSKSRCCLILFANCLRTVISLINTQLDTASAAMTQTIPKGNHHALLIGVNAYTERPLQGSAHDVRCIKAIFEDKVNAANVQLLTATLGDGNKPFVENREALPTESNIVAAFNNIIRDVTAGDYVYIHYSGHGTIVRPSVDPENVVSNQFAGDLALALLHDQNPMKVQILPGKSLAELLNCMIDHGLILTIVLVCHFFAAVYRDDDEPLSQTKLLSIRCLELVEASNQDPAYVEDYTAALGSVSEYRDADMLSNWMLDPSKYSMLVAVDPAR